MPTEHQEPQRPTEIARLALTRLPAETPLDEVFAKACELATEAIQVERVGVWMYVEDGAALRCVNLYERSRGEHSAGAMLRVADFPSYFQALTIRKSVPAEVAANDPRTAELTKAYLEPLEISSMLDAGIFVGNDLVGVVCHEHVGATREWTTESRDFAGSIADLLALRIQSAKLEDMRKILCIQASRQALLEKAALVEQMAAGLTHDFRNILTVVIGNADLLASRDDLSPEAREQLKNLKEAANRGVALASELTEFARPTERPAMVLNLDTVTQDFLSVLRASIGTRHPLKYERPSTVGKVLIDKGQYTRVLLNLVMNARDALPNGGNICLRVSPVRLLGGSETNGHYIMLEVSDNGVGMDEDTRHRALLPFFTTKSTGTGVGLFVVKRIADRAGGFVKIESEPGKGTTIRVYFPRVGASSNLTMEMPAFPSQ